MCKTTKKTQLKNIVACVLAFLMLLLLLIPQAGHAEKDYSTIRVRLNTDSTSLSVTVTGDYTVKEKSSIELKSGKTYTVKVSGSKVNLSGSGVDTTLSSVTFVRGTQEVSSDHLLKIGSYSYLGDMKFIVNSGKVRAINTLNLEHYLYGVVTAEMGNSFPLEALKAQAVGARGYAINKIDSSDSSDTYDIIGSASNQAYRGYNAKYTKVIEAVNSTKGQVLVRTDNGKIIEPYYTASNGGQTEWAGAAWGGGTSKDASYPYLIQRDDPYDLASCAGKSAYEQVIFVPADPSASVSSSDTYSNPVLNDFQNQAYSALKTKYDLDSASDLTLVSVNSFVNGKKRWSAYENSRSYVTAIANITVALPEGAVDLPEEPETPETPEDPENPETQEPQLYTETLDVTITLMNPTTTSYSLSHDYLNGSFRLRSVEETEGGWNLLNRRFGHGVGMSQMGAKNMAEAHGMKYTEILEFYYPNTTMKTLVTESPEPTPPSEPVTPPLTNDDIMTGIAPETDAAALLQSLGGSYTLYDASSTPKTSGTVVTGDTVKDAEDKLYTVIIYGDLNCDGVIDLADLLRQQKNLLGTATLNTAATKAADVTKDGSVDLADLLRIQKHLLGTTTISQSQ